MKQTERYRHYRIFLYGLLTVVLCAAMGVSYLVCRQRIPSTIRIRAGMEERMDFSLPASGLLVMKTETSVGRDVEPVSGDAAIPVSLNRPLTFYASRIESYQMDVKLFGIVPLKKVEVQVVPDMSLIPAGIPIGIYVKTEGVLVIDTGEFTDADGVRQAPSHNLLKSGDYILSMNGEAVTGKKMFMERLQELGEGPLTLTVRRGEEEFDVRVLSLPDMAGTLKIGIWIRDNAQGVGTLTYLDENGDFGALGHGINDMDTSTLMTIEKGTLYHTEIVGIKKGDKGAPGELTGVIDYASDNVMGSIEKNSEEGIFGVCQEALLPEGLGKSMPVGLKQEVKLGPAEIMLSLDEGRPRSYEVQIREIDYSGESDNRSMVLEITDEELLQKTGGIVQGMSGSPIIQDGKLIGAVTHVFVQDSTRGYGIFIENMLEH